MLQTTRLRAVDHRNVDDEVVSVIQPVCKDSCEVGGMVGGDDGVTDHEMRILIHAGAGGGGKAWPCHVWSGTAVGSSIVSIGSTFC